MDVGHRVGRAFILLSASAAALSLGSGCGRGAADGPPSASVIATPRAPDQLAPGEVAESNEEAFGLAIPAGLRVTRRDHDMVVAEGSLAPEDVSNFVRSRVREGEVETGPGRTSFVRVGVVKPLSPWKGRLRIDVEGVGKFTSLRIVGEPELPPGNASAVSTAQVKTVPLQQAEGKERPPRL